MCRSLNRGVTLVELIVFIVIVGVAMAGLFAAFNTITAASADPQVRKQALAIAESLMEEVQLMPFTFCDPDDPNAATATNAGTGAGGCTSALTSEDTTMGPETVPSLETRYSTTSRFDNVSDYHGFSMSSGIQDIEGNNITGLEAYSASITITRAGTALGLAADENALKISVQVNGPGSVAVTLEGYRARYAPNTLP
jgi:MSHA pilin protein MshD